MLTILLHQLRLHIQAAVFGRNAFEASHNLFNHFRCSQDKALQIFANADIQVSRCKSPMRLSKVLRLYNRRKGLAGCLPAVFRSSCLLDIPTARLFDRSTARPLSFSFSSKNFNFSFETLIDTMRYFRKSFISE